MITERLKQTMALIANFYDGCRHGYEGHEGYRKSTDLFKLSRGIEELEALGLLDCDRTVFADLGCADGRVNLLMSYFVRLSLGIEIDGEILAEYGPRKAELESRLRQAGLEPPPCNLALFHGSSPAPETYAAIQAQHDISFSDIDLFYTYITLHDVFAEKIAAEAKPGALYLVYGFNRILPRYEHLEVMIPDLGSQGIAALYRKGHRRGLSAS